MPWICCISKAHKDASASQIILNLDFVGDGDILQLEPVRLAQQNIALVEKLMIICGKKNGKEIRLAKGRFTGSSDHKHFPNGVGIKALHHRKGIGDYCGRIHTRRDRMLD